MTRAISSLVFSTLIVLFSFTSFASEICSGNGGKTALVVIDMQPKFVTRGGNDQTPENKAKVEQIITAQTAAIKYARRSNIPIVFLEYEGDYGDTNNALKTAVANYKEVKFFKKSSDGMFEDYNKYKKDLVDYLAQKKVGTLVITGANGGACVLQSITGALDGNCSVIAFNKGIADFNYKDFIYPYVNQYANIKPNCKSCVFKEAPSLDDVILAVGSGSKSDKATPPSYQGAGAVK